MTRPQSIEEIKQLSIAERITLIEMITRTLREDLATGQDAASALSNSEVSGEDARARKIAAVRRLRGVAKSAGEPPSDEELKEDYANYLTEKYS